MQIQQAILFESQGKPNESLKILEKILAEDPNHPDALNLSGVIFIKLHHYEKGIKLIKRAIKKAPKIGTFHFNLANAYVMQNELEKARKEFTNAIKLDNTKEEYYRNLGITLIQLHFYRAAEYNFRQAIKINPSNLDNKLNLASSLLHQFHSKQALKMMKDIEKSATKEQNIPYFFYKNLALAFLTMGQSDLAEKNYLRAISRDEKDLELWVGLALAYANQMKIVEAESAYEKAIEFGADYFENKIAIANALMEAGEYQRSKIVINEVINKRPDYESALISAAKIDGRFGDFDLQENKLRKVLSLNKNSIDAYAQLTQVPGREIKEEEIRIIEKEVNNKSIEGQSKITLAFSLGDIYRQKKNYEKSYNYYKMGNDLKPFVFDQEKYKEYIDKIIETYNKEFFVEMSQFGSESVLPVLIVGTPRSGTTLTEQILSTHAKVFGAGERGTVIGLANTEKQKLPRLDLSPQAIHEVANEKIIEFY